MMTDLVRNDIGLGEFTRRMKALLQIIVKGQVDVDLVIARAVERPHRRLGKPAGRTHRAGEEHQLGFFVSAASGAKNRTPGVFGVGKNHRHKTRLLVGMRRWPCH